MRLGHATTLRWPAATRCSGPQSGHSKALLNRGGLAYSSQSRRQLSTGHGRNSLSCAEVKSTVGSRPYRRLRHICCSSFSFIHGLPSKAYSHGQLGVERHSAGCTGKPFGDSAYMTRYDTTATWKTSTVGAGAEVEITHADVPTDHDQQTDQLAIDEDHEEHADENELAAEDAVDTPHALQAATGSSSKRDADRVMPPIHDSRTALDGSAHDFELKPRDFGARERPHLDVPLQRNALVVTSTDRITLFSHWFASKRIEEHLGFQGIGFVASWPTEKWTLVPEWSLLDLAKAIEDCLVTRAERSITSLSDATNALSATLPGSPGLRIGLKCGTYHIGDGRVGDSYIKLSSLDTYNPVQFFLPQVVVNGFNPSLSMDRATQDLMVGVSVGGTLAVRPGEGESAESALQSLMDFLEPIARTVVKDPNTRDLQHAARLISSHALYDARTASVIDFNKASIRIRPRVDGNYQPAVRVSFARYSNDAAIFVALGSNIGDRVAAIEDALRVLDGHEKIKLLQTSPLYETEPMYVEDQERFLNGVCKIETQLDPIELLDTLQAIELDLGRVKLIDKGPRNIDLDIIAYGRRIIQSDRLVVPHRLMLEREFVLRPLCDIAENFVHPQTVTPVLDHLTDLPLSSTPMYPLTPLAPGLTLCALDPLRKTIVMSILNVTPDSFSDGGVHQTANVEALKATVSAHIAAGAKIIDIGGQSSRPNALDISAEEELARILPAIEAIKSLPEAAHVAISVDTYRAAVAEAAINAGAHIINDISAGLLDPDMLSTIARLGCTYIMMHMRGTPDTMQNEENTSYSHGLIPSIITELKGRLRAAEEAGIRRWRIVLDPGIGFAKTAEQNLEILRSFETLRQARGLSTYPWLVGSSRKGFIGKITGVENAADRISGTAATVTAAVQGGAEIVRVHDVEEMVQVVKMADAMYRVPRS